MIRVPPEHAGMRADAFLALALPWLSRTLIRRKVQQGEALLGNRRFATSARLRAGDEIEVMWRAEGPAGAASHGVGAAGPAPQLRVLYEDEHYIAVDKPAGMLSHPSGGIQEGTAIQVVRAMLRGETERALAAGDADRYPTLAGRLDRFTSGVLLVAKSRQALAALQELRRMGQVHREYFAVVEGLLEDDEGSIDLPLGPDSSSQVGIRMAARPDGLPCRTDYRVSRRLAGCTVLIALPATGRQHQVRAHFASIGHPVVGDLIYRDERLFLAYWRDGCRLGPGMPARHLLHARSVAFTNPFTGTRVEVSSETPPDITEMLAKLS